MTPMDVVVSIPRAITCGETATTTLSTKNHKNTTTIVMVVAAEAAIEDAVIIPMEAITAKAEEINAKAKPINRILDAATGRMTASIGVCISC